MRAPWARKAGVGGRTSAARGALGHRGGLGRAPLPAIGLRFRNVIRGSRGRTTVADAAAVRFKHHSADSSAMRKPTEIRQPAAMRIYFVFFGLLWVGTLLVPYGIRSGSDALVILLFGVVGVAFIARTASLRVIADESGLHVRNFFRTQHLGWEEIEDFRLGRPMSGLPFGWVIHALLTNEEVVTLDVTASNWSLAFGGRAKREQVLNTLREWLPPRN